ncbi:MAG TPA: efflux RND transporter periplasmic adaptor subunit [Xanthobacteraceae bacterium]
MGAAGAAIGFHVGRGNQALPDWVPSSISKMLDGAPAVQRVPSPTGPVVYYRDPDGKPFYSASPKSTADGRPFLAVHANEDSNFDVPAQESKRILYYRNPMGLPDTSPVPKKDSMGMDYLPVYEGEAADDTVVKLSPGKIQRTGVRSEPAARRPIAHLLHLPGTVKLDERRITVVSMRADSFIEHVENITTGDHVKKGQRLLELFSPDVNAAAAQLIANPGLEGSRRRLENLNVPANVIADMEHTRKVPLTIVWSAPRDGVVLERNATEGMKASSGQVLFRIADISTIWVLADVPEQEMAGIKPGQAVAIRAQSIPGRTFPGQVALIYPQLNADTRTVRVRIELSNKDEALLPEMYTDVDIEIGSGAPVLTVPESALIDTGTRQVVILDKGDGRFEPREVSVGTRGNNLVEIRSGIGEGDQVVVSANFLIDAESNLKAALQGLNSSEGAR